MFQNILDILTTGFIVIMGISIIVGSCIGWYIIIHALYFFFK